VIVKSSLFGNLRVSYKCCFLDQFRKRSVFLFFLQDERF